MVNFGDALRKGLVFCIEPKRWLPLFILDIAALGIVLGAFLSNIDSMMSGLVEAESNPLAMMPLTGLIAGFLVLGAVWFILRMWITGSLVHQSFRPREFENGFRLSFSKLPRIIVAVILTSVISGLLSSIPWVGWVISIFIGLAFFFMVQGIILDDLGAISTLKGSWNFFRKSPFDVFIAWLLIAIISSLILLVFAIPILSLFIGMFMSNAVAGTMEAGGMVLMLMYLQNNLTTVVVFGVIALLGMEFSQVFSTKAQTEFYLQLRKGFPSIIKAFARKKGRFF